MASENTDDRIFRIKRNLKDAGCDRRQIEKYLEMEEEKKRDEQYRLLARHKAGLLDALHKDQYKIDCLDHMVYVMEKEDAQKKT